MSRYRNSLALSLFATVLPIVSVASGSSPQASSAQDGALATVQTFVRANETANLDLLLSTFDEDATVFFPNAGPLPPDRISGKVQIRRIFEAILKSRTGPITITPRDVMVQVFGDVAIVTLHLAAVPTTPIQQAIAFPRRTFVLRRTGDRWLIVHHHASNAQISPPSK